MTVLDALFLRAQEKFESVISFRNNKMASVEKEKSEGSFSVGVINK